MYSTNSLEEANAIMQKNIYKYNKRKGEFAEKNVEHMLSFLGKDKYITIPKKSEGRYGDKCILLHNPTAYEHPQEYDHIIIGSQGIFLIETKNYSGKICIGKAGNWARTGKHGDVKNDKDPLIQIKHHEKVMASIVGEKVNIFSILCLANQSVKIQNANYFPRPILKSDALTDFIETLEVENPLSTEEMKHLKELILKYSK